MAFRTKQTALLALPPLSWFVSQQLSSFLLHVRCRSADGTAWQESVAVLAIFCLALVGPVFALQVRSTSQSQWLRQGVFLWSGVFAMAILYEAMAGLLLPACLA